MKLALTLFVALAAINTAVVLNPVIRTTRIGTVPFNLAAGSESCPKEIVHGKGTQIAQGTSDFQGFGIEAAMPFTEITVDGEKCEGKNNDTAYMAVLSNTELERYWKENPLKLASNESVKIIVAGFDTDVRKCGDYEANTGEMFYLFTKDIEFFEAALNKKNIVIEEKYKQSGDKWLVSYETINGDNPCVYIDSQASALKKLEEVTPEPQAPDATPKASPAVSPLPIAPVESDPAATPDPTTTAAPENVCFPASATVELSDGSTKTMDRVELGDRVKVSDGSFSTVFMFSHKMANVKHSFVNVKTSAGAELSLTAGHFIYVNNELVPAGSIKVGDFVESASGELLTVKAVSNKVLSGLYNPQTEHGDIVVNGVRASTFTTTALPAAAHALLAPIRSIYSGFGITASFLDAGMDTLRRSVRSVLA